MKEAASVFPGIKFMPITIERSGSHSAIIQEGTPRLKKDDSRLFYKYVVMVSMNCTIGWRTERDEIEKIMILGGGRVGYKVAKELSSEGYKVKLVEIDANKAENIANSLSNVLVLNIDGTRVDLTQRRKT